MRKIVSISFLSIVMILFVNSSILAQEDNHSHHHDTALTVDHEATISDTLTVHHEEAETIVSHENTDASTPEAHGSVAAHAEHGEGGEGHSGGHTDMSPLFFIILALIIGAATRHFFRKIPLPFTVLLLLIGIGMGLLERFDMLTWSETLNGAIKWAGNKLDPHIILFVFLPTLIFEAAFAMDVHTFKKTAVNASIMAVPGIIVAMFLTGGIMIAIDKFGLGLEGWGANAGFIALMFGAVISATDPVAVVALLKELGASKKLGTLIEGESVMNDGTAIVIFMVFFIPLTIVLSTAGLDAESIKLAAEHISGMAPEGIKAAAETILSSTPAALSDACNTLGYDAAELTAAADTFLSAGGNPIVAFGKVALGGIFLGIVIGAVSLAWVRRVFNDALIEISVIVAAAYITFFIAEDFLHVSGVLGLLALGLAMAGVGKTRISPEVQHFLHEFWELAAFIANVLIFLIVGVVIAQRAQFTGQDLIILGILYIGVHLVRMFVITLFYPIMRKSGYGLDVKNATIVWYGALRGAIGLALALIVAQIPYDTLQANGMAEVLNLSGAQHWTDIQNQFLFLTAGIVTLTLLINATTIKLLVNKLGLTKIAPAKAMMINNANHYLRTSSINQLDRLKSDRFISNANWSQVKEYLPDEPKEAIIEGEIDTIAEMRKRCLEKEKSSYWHLFKDGLLGSVAVRRLSDIIDSMLDDGGSTALSHRKDLELLMDTPKLLSWLQTIPLLKNITRQMFFERLAVSYDCARGFIEAQEDVIKLIESMHRSLDKDDIEGNRNLDIIEEETNENKIEGLTFIRNLRKSYPEIYDAIATRQAIRMLLNYELKTVERLQKNGRIDGGEAHKMIHTIEERMKKLLQKPPKVKLPDADQFIREIDWLSDLEPETLTKLGEFFVPKLFPQGAKVIKESAASDGIYLIARGTAKVTIDDQVLDLVSEGQIVGEMGILVKENRTATVTAESPLTTFFISDQNIQQLMAQSPKLSEKLWKISGERHTSNILKQTEPYVFWRPKKFSKWIQKGEVVVLKEGENYELGHDKVGVLFSGKAKIAGTSQEIKAPSYLHVSKFTLNNKGHVYICDKIEE